MPQIHTHYDNLKVARDAPPEVIRAAYKTLSQKFHPDRNPHKPNATRTFQLINHAYEVLSDPVKRRAHDEWISAEEAKQLEQQPHHDFANHFIAEPRQAVGGMPHMKTPRAWKTRYRASGLRALPPIRKEWFSFNNLFKYFFWLLLPTLILVIAIAV
jgi:DnaJ-class molecular chaperone